MRQDRFGRGFANTIALAALAAGSGGAAAQTAGPLPEGVTPAMVEEGRTIFHGTGLCSTCHGENGVGTQLAPNLTDAEWLNIDGSFDAIVNLVTTGVPQPKQHMVPMAAKGGSEITDEEVQAVAAYVWTLCRAAAQQQGRSADTCSPVTGDFAARVTRLSVSRRGQTPAEMANSPVQRISPFPRR